MNHGSFWTKVCKAQQILGDEAMGALLPFATTYSCETVSALTDIKTSTEAAYKSRLT